MSKTIRILDVDFKGKTYRFGDDRFFRSIDDGDGNTIVVYYKPVMTSVSAKGSEADFDGSPSIPTAEITIWDADKSFKDLFDGVNFEEASATLRFMEDGGEEVGRIEGYLTDFSHRDGETSFTIRGQSDIISEDVFKYFSWDTFQHVQTMYPYRVNLEPSFTLQSDVPWKLFKKEFRGVELVKQFRLYPVAASGSYFGRMQPGVRGGRVTNHVAVNADANAYVRYVLKEAFLLKVGIVDTSYTYQIDIDGTTYSYTFNVADQLAGETDEQTILRELGDAIGVDYTVDYYEETVRLYVQADPSLVSASTLAIDAGYLDFWYDDSVAGSEKQLVPENATNFSDGGGTIYKIAVIGNTQDQADYEVFAYSHVEVGQVYDPENSTTLAHPASGNYLIFSGIPTDDYPDPISNWSSITALDPSISNVTEFKEKYGINNDHSLGELVSPWGAHDKVFISTNGLSPYSEDDPTLGAGFISFGETIQNTEKTKNYYYFHRYKIVDIHTNIYDDNIRDGTMLDEVIECEIHNRPTSIDPAHTYSANLKQSRWELPRSITPESQVLLADYEFTVSYIDYDIGYLPEDLYEKVIAVGVPEVERGELKDRWRGHRFDMVADAEDLEQVLSYGSEDVGGTVSSQSISKLNSRMVNNANGKFAIATGSEIILNDDTNPSFGVERVYFYATPNDQPDGVWIEEMDLEDTSETGTSDERSISFQDGVGQDVYVNYLTFKPAIENASIQSDNFSSYKDDAELYFVDSRYRVIKDPVPEGSSQLGQMIPIVYGVQKRVPMIQAISKKTFSTKSSTAGDDFYIYASHPCDVNSATDIVIEMFDPQGQEPGQDIEKYDANLKFDIIKSPFPQVEEGHHKVEYYDSGYPSIRYAGPINTPYHDIEALESFEGDRFYGVRLQGFRWNPRAGKLDKRYPIRHGVGSTPLYATFNGWVDKDGEITGEAGQLIEHPLDILHHYAINYGVSPFNSAAFDMDSLLRVRARTNDYRASVWLKKKSSVWELAEELCKPFGIFHWRNNGQLSFGVFDERYIDYTKPLIEGRNILEIVEESDDGYKDVFTEVIYKYSRNHRENSFDGEIRLDKYNNRYCASASRARGGKAAFQVDAEAVNDGGVARLAARRIASYVCRKRTYLDLRVKVEDGVSYQPGDILPVYSLNLGLDQGEPVMVISAQRDRNFTKMKVVKFHD